MDSGNGKKVWHRYDRETAKAYEAFCIYRDQGPNRSIQGTAVELGKSFTPIRRWAKKWGWIDRAMEWDEHLQTIRDHEIEDTQRLHANRRHESILRTSEFELSMSERVEEKLNEMLNLPVVQERVIHEQMELFKKEGNRYVPQTVDTVGTIMEPAGWNFRDMVAAMVEVSKLRRLANDLPTSTGRIDLLTYVRQKAEDHGLDPDEAVTVAEDFIRRSQQ